MKHLIVLIFLTLLLSGCTPVKNVLRGEGCYVQSWHFESYNPTCAPVNNPCPADIRPTDFCGRFISCDDSCSVVKDPLYDVCLDCFLDLYTKNISDDCFSTFPEFRKEYLFDIPDELE